jgi:hypothetical protein
MRNGVLMIGLDGVGLRFVYSWSGCSCFSKKDVEGLQSLTLDTSKTSLSILPK